MTYETTYTVVTQHGVLTEDGWARETHTAHFTDTDWVAAWDKAQAYAHSNDPETDSTMCPQVEAGWFDHPGFDTSVQWLGHQYAVIIRSGRELR